jgi:Zn-dependent oligopeptidase
LLLRADTRDPMELYRAFRARELTITALLAPRGLPIIS